MLRSKALLGLCLLISAIAHADVVDAILATVGKEAILRSEVIDEVGPLLRDMQQTLDAATFEAEANKALGEALERAIENKILYREAIAAGAKIEDKDVEAVTTTKPIDFFPA